MQVQHHEHGEGDKADGRVDGRHGLYIPLLDDRDHVLADVEVFLPTLVPLRRIERAEWEEDQPDAVDLQQGEQPTVVAGIRFALDYIPPLPHVVAWQCQLYGAQMVLQGGRSLLNRLGGTLDM